MKLSKEQRSGLINDLIETALDVLHHDIDIDDETGKWAIKSLQEGFGKILDSAK